MRGVWKGVCVCGGGGDEGGLGRGVWGCALRKWVGVCGVAHIREGVYMCGVYQVSVWGNEWDCVHKEGV